ncbi:decapping and exoribonuclease protein-like [Panonychus citri]|uniref:decapping and exoribonuclease protein-like n=1 Tax=Panonychus citri TaxID=50023 RepID=UPI0023073080|nr:decapping and exoribonuclease protein-like [Panonychus citri]
MDLLVGFHPEKTWGRVPPGEMHILRWFNDNFYECTHQEDNEEDDEGKVEEVSIDFICYTRMLRSVMNAPYNNRQDWICIAIKVRESIILDEIDTPSRQASTDGQTNRQKAASYAGYKFEEIITRRYDGVHRPTHDEGNRDSFYIVSKVKLNKHTILYCNRVDCALNKDQLDKPVDKMEFAQIKTRSANYYTAHQAKTFFWRKKVIPWWIESMLGNINQIVCGDKDDNFYIRKISKLQVNSLPDERNIWSPRTCVTFLDMFLSFIKSMVTDELTPYRFYCVPGKAIVCQKMNEPVENYLPSWFINDEEPYD